MKRSVVAALLVAFVSAGCRRDMYDQPKAKSYSKSDFFPDATTARPMPANTVQYHCASGDDAFYAGLSKDLLVAQLPRPMELTPQLLARGRERYDIYCAVCHGVDGSGHGQVVQRGFPMPPTYHSERLRNAPLAHFYDVITNGYGMMYSYASRLSPPERWAVSAYIRALQLSQSASASELEPDERSRLEGIP